MKFLNKKTFALLVLLGVTGYSFGYQYELSNASDKVLVVKLVERLIGLSTGHDDKYATLQPHETKVVKLPGLWCLKAIQARSFDKLADVPSDINTTALLDVTIKMESSNDKNKVDTVEKAPAKGTTSGFSEIEKGATALDEESLCRDRKFTLMLTGKKAQRIVGDKTYSLPFDEIVAVTQKGR